MIISQRHELAFVHNPKVGGTSIRQAIGHLHDGPIPFWHQDWDPNSDRVVDLAHLTVDQWDDPDVIPANYFTFGFVRNPYTRFWSALNEFLRRHGQYMPITKDNISMMLTPANIRYDWRFVHFCPQHAFFYQGNRCRVDFIGRQERMERDWAAVAALTGNVMPAALPEEKARATTADLYDPDLKDQAFVQNLINRLYLKDFQLFGYDMVGNLGIRDVHADRIEVIHNPLLVPWFHGQELGALSFTPGERKSLEAQRATIHPQS